MNATGHSFEQLTDLPLGSRNCFSLPVAAMPDGSTLSVPINVLVGSSHHPALVAVAGQHGDEHEGPTALIEIWDNTDPESMKGSLLVIPVLNPPAFRAAKRWSDEDLVDINRIFPGTSDGTVTHRIAHAFMERVATQADFILSMHGWSAGYLVHPYTEFPIAGPTARAGWEGAMAFGLPHLNPLDSIPGTLMHAASKRGLPLIEVEIGGQGTSVAERRHLYEVGTRKLMRQLGILSKSGAEVVSPKYVDRVECLAPTGGLTRPEVGVGDEVEEGQPLAAIYDLNLRRREIVLSPCRGMVGVLRLSASTLPGQLMATIFKPVDWVPPTGPTS